MKALGACAGAATAWTPCGWQPRGAEMNQSRDGEHRCGDDEQVDEKSACHRLARRRSTWLGVTRARQ